MGCKPKHGKIKTPEYRIWSELIQRCTNPKNPSYEKYGGRGIKVCDAWLKDFRSFWKDMCPRPSKELTLERLNNNLGYNAKNCSWATRDQQGRNTSRTILFTHQGKTQCLKDWAIERGLNIPTVYSRVRMGWAIEDVVLTPSIKRAKS